MLGWKARVDINTHLDDNAASVPERASRVIAALREDSRESLRNRAFATITEGLVEAADAEDWEAFDDLLDRLYDVADHERIWLGPPTAREA